MVWTYHGLFSYSPVEGLLSYFQFGDIMNKATIKSYMFCMNVSLHFSRINAE
jgi:hypothetical protein